MVELWWLLIYSNKWFFRRCIYHRKQKKDMKKTMQGPKNVLLMIKIWTNLLTEYKYVFGKGISNIFERSNIK